MDAPSAFAEWYNPRAASADGAMRSSDTDPAHVEALGPVESLGGASRLRAALASRPTARGRAGRARRGRGALTALVAAAWVGACSSEGSGLDADPVAPDAGALPDARVLPPRDAGGPAAPAPTLTRVTPDRGPTGGGTRVTLRGTAFLEPAEVFFGVEAAQSVVVLDEQTIAVTAPPGALGATSVRVVTEGGRAELPNAFTYVRALRLDAVSPARIPDEGGVEVTVVGAGFTPETVILLDRRPLRGLEILDEQTARGFSPALAVGRPEVRVVTRDGAVRRSDVLTVFGTPDLVDVAPGYGPADGGARQEILGRGLGDAEAVRIGGRAAEGLEVLDQGRRLAVGAPALPVGVHDVEVENPDARGRRLGAYVAFDPARSDLHVLGTAPARVPAGTAAWVTVVGGGFDERAQVALGVRRLVLRSASERALVVELPADLAPGTATLEILQGGERREVPIEVYAPIAVTGVTPASGPATGGTEVTLTGSGFGPDVEVRIGDVPLADVVVVDETTLTGRTVAGSHGPADVEVRSGADRSVLAGAFAFVETFEVVRVEPTEGSVAGNTYVSIIGRGFDAPASVAFGEAPGLDPRLENGAILSVRSPPSPPGAVDLEIALASGDETLDRAFSFFDPRLIAGGAWGGAIEGAVNVAVIDGDGTPVSGMTVQLGYDADPRYRALTDANGLATISSPEIRGAQTVTVGGEEQGFGTFVDIDARNLTFISGAFPQPPAPDTPIQPCPPDPPPPPTIRGQVFELKSALDDETSPDVIPVVQITYSEANVFSPNPPEPVEQIAVVTQEGQEYEIVTTRAGSVAVYAILGDFDQARGTFTPRRMGIVRGVPVAPDTVTDGIDIALDIEMDRTLRIRLDEPPDQNPGPGLNAVFPFLNLDSDGVIPFQASVVQGSGEVVLENMPALPESQFFYMGGSFSQAATGGLASPFSLTLRESNAPFDEGVDLGPFLEMPTNVRPKQGEVLVDGRLSFDQGGPVPDLVTMSVSDSRVIPGQCCVDLDMNGQCDAGEPVQGGALPVPFNRWRLFARGGEQSYAFPRMPLDVPAFEAPRSYQLVLQLALAPRFSWDEFAYNQFSPFFWQSWVEWVGVFTVKDETD